MDNKLIHYLCPHKCLKKAAWVGNLYVCPVCHRSVACGFGGKVYLFPPWLYRADANQQIPAQPEWFMKDDGWEQVREFMKEVIASIDIYADEEIDDEMSENVSVDTEEMIDE